MAKYTIAPDFEHLLRDHTSAEQHQLEENVVNDPKHERMPPIAIWANNKNVVLDGHHQLHLREKHRLTIKFTKLEFETRDEALAYAIKVQLGRRNLSPSELAMVLAKLPKNTHGGNRKSDQVENLPLARTTIAAEHGISDKTLRVADKVRESGASSVVHAVERGEIKVSDAAAVADLPKSEQSAALRKVKAGEAKTLREAAHTEEEESSPDDSVGQPIPKQLSEVFERAKEFEQHARTLTAIAQWADKISGELPGKWLHVQSFKADLSNAKRALRHNKPYAVCPYCQAKKKSCEACKGLGFVSKRIYDSAPQEMRV